MVKNTAFLVKPFHDIKITLYIYFEANAEINLACLDGEQVTYVGRDYGKNTVMHKLNWKSHLLFSQLRKAEQESYREAYIQSGLETRNLNYLCFPTTHVVMIDNAQVNATCKKKRNH